MAGNNVQLLIIDPQKSFCSPNGSLFVPGAVEDSARTAALINRLSTRIKGINITFDSHSVVDIAHPIFWVDSEGNNPSPFTIISVDDIEQGRYRTANPGWMPRASDYVKQLAKGNRYPLCIWPEHCLIGTEGACLEDEIAASIFSWERKKLNVANKVTKGSNPWTEHYSAVRAEVEDPIDPTTSLNGELIKLLASADVIGVMGQALSHCLANTVRDIAAEFGTDNIRKMVLIRDCTSNVPGFEQLGEDFIKEMTAQGMQISTSAGFLA